MQSRVNVGDVVINGTDMWGDGVNVAARLEALARPGGICISSRVQEDLHGRLDVAFEDMANSSFKNIARPVRVYRVQVTGTAATPAPALPDTPMCLQLGKCTLLIGAHQPAVASNVSCEDSGQSPFDALGHHRLPFPAG